MDEKAKKLYDNLTADGYKLGTYDEFVNNMTDPVKSQKFYSNLSADGYKLGNTYDDFYSTLGLKKKGIPEPGFVGEEAYPVSSKSPAPQAASESALPSGTSSWANRSVNPMADMANADVELPQAPAPEVEKSVLTPQTPPPDPEQVARGHSYIQGFAKEFNKSLSGTLRLADYAVNKLESTIGSAFFGKEFESARKVMADAGIGGSPFGGAADLVDRTNAGAKDVPDNVLGAVVGGVGGIVPDLMGMALMPEVKVGGWLAKYGVQGVDKFAMYLAGKEGTASVQASEGGMPMQQMTEPLQGAAKGFTTGLLFNSFGKVSGKIGEGIAQRVVTSVTTPIAATNRALVQGGASTLSNALMFGGYSGLEEFAQTGKITSKNVATNFGIGLALGAKDLGKLTFVRGMQSFIATPREQINKVAQSKASPEEMKAMSDESLAQLNKAVEPIDQFKLNEDIYAAQQRLGLPNEPEVQISENTLETLAKLQRGEPVTNDVLSQASNELYQIRKGLEGVSKTPNRKFTTDQIFQKTNALGNIIETLENAKQVQTENDAFLDAQSNHVVSAVVNDNLATLKAFTQEVIANPEEVKDAVNESDLPEAAKQELNQKIDQIAADNQPSTIAAKPLEDKIAELNQSMQSELDANSNIEQSDIAKGVKQKQITEKYQGEISDLEQQVRGIYENPPSAPAPKPSEIAPEQPVEQVPDRPPTEAGRTSEVEPQTPLTNGKEKEEGQGLLAVEPKDLEQTKKYDCGASALRSILEAFGEKITEAEMIKETESNNEVGTQIGKIVEAAKNHGLDAESRENGTAKDIESEIAKGNNVILLQEGVGTTKNGEDYSGTKDGHYITVKSADGNKITFEDPATTGAEEMTYADLEKRWHGLRDDNETIARGQMVVVKSKGQGLLDQSSAEQQPQVQPEQATSTDQTAQKPPKSKETTSTKFVNKPLSEINTDEARFQNRTELDEDQLNQIISKWNDNELDPVVIWKDKNGKTYLLAGHHRLEAAKRIGKKTIPARYFEGSEAEAITYAKEKSNANRTMEQPFDRAKIYRKMREDGKTKKEIRTALEQEGKNKTLISALSYLNPDGKVMGMLKALAKSGDMQTERITKQAAQWIGEAREFFSELTNQHENELYDWLINKGNLNKIGTKTEFIDRLSRVADAIRMNPEEPLNLDHRRTYGTLESEKNAEIKAKVAEIKELERERDNTTKPVTPERLNQITKAIGEKNSELSKLKEGLAAAIEGDKSQIDMFSQINEEVNNGTVTRESVSRIEEQSAAEAEKLEPTVADIESKAESADEAELAEAVRRADEIINPEPVKEGGQDAIQEPNSTPLDVSKAPENGEAVGGGNAVNKETAKEGKAEEGVEPKTVEQLQEELAQGKWQGRMKEYGKAMEGARKREQFEPSTATQSLPLQPQEKIDFTTGDLNDIVTLRQIGQDLVNKIGLKHGASVRHGLIRRFTNRALALFFPNLNLIRVNTINDIRSLSHEIGHYLDLSVFGISKVLNDKSIIAELKDVARDAGFPKSKVTKKEGIAEFVNHFIVDPNRARTLAPKFNNFFENLIAANPDIKTALLSARDQFERFKTQDPRQIIESTINRDAKNNSWLNGIKKFFQGGTDRLIYNLFDNVQMIRNLDKVLNKENLGVSSGKSPTLSVLSLIGADGKATQMLENHPFLRNGDDIMLLKNIPGLMKTLSPIIKSGEMKGYEGYMVALRNLELHKNNHGDAATASADVSQKAVDLYEKQYGKDVLDKFVKDIRDFEDAVIEYYYQSGKISAEGKNRMYELNKYHVPFKRFFEDFEETGSFGSVSRNIKDSSPSPVKSIRGSQRQITSPFEAIIRNTYDIIASADRNYALRNIVDALKLLQDNAKGKGKVSPFVQEIPGYKIKTVRDLKSGEMVYTMINEKPKGKIVTVYENGKAKYYDVDPEIYDSFFAVSEQVSNFIKVLSLPSRWLQAGAVVYDPTFMFRNIPRDQMSGTFYSNYGYDPTYFIRGISNVFKKSDIYQKWLASGADQSFVIDMDKMLSRHYLENKVDAKLKSKWSTYTKNPLLMLQDISRISEIGTRVGAFQNAYKKTGGDAFKAMEEARTIAGDYGVKGGALKNVSPLMPFFNARLQHAKLTALSIKNHPYRTLAKGLAFVTAPAIANWMLNNIDDESKKRYQALPTWRKLGAWNIHIPGTDSYLPIPKGFFGTAFGSSVESFLDYVVNQDDRSAGELVQQLFREISPMTSVVEFAPQAIRPVIEQWANKKSFTGREIVPESMKDLSPSEQYFESTPEIIKKIGEYTGLSPLRVETFIKSYTGGAGSGAVVITDELLQIAGVVDKKPDDKFTVLSKMPVTKAFVTETPRGSRSSYIQDFYDRLDKMEELNTTINRLVADDNDKKIQSILSNKKTEADYTYYIQNQTEINRFKDVLRYVKSMKHDIYNDKTIDDKREQMEKLDDIITELGIRFMHSYDNKTKFKMGKDINDIIIKSKINKRVDDIKQKRMKHKYKSRGAPGSAQ